MSYKYCLISVKDAEGPNLGYKYIKEHKSEWIDAGSTIIDYLAAGWTQGVDCVVYNDKVYLLKKTYILVEDHTIVHLCVESNRGCDVID